MHKWPRRLNKDRHRRRSVNRYASSSIVGCTIVDVDCFCQLEEELGGVRRKLLESQQMVDIMKNSNRELNAKVVSLSKLAS